jgi:WD40 repeat protein
LIKLRFVFPFAILLSAFTFVIGSHAQTIPHYEEIARVGRGEISQIEWHPTEDIIAVSSSAGIWLLNPKLEAINHIEFLARTQDLIWSPGGEWLAANIFVPEQEDRRDHWLLWRLENDALIPVFDDLGDITQVEWNATHPQVAIINSGSLSVVDISTNNALLHIDSGEISDASWNPDGDQLAILNAGQLEIYNADFVQEATFEAGEHGMASIWWSPDGRKIAAKSGGELYNTDHALIYVWNIETNQRVTLESEFVPNPYRESSAPPETIREPINAASWSPDSKTLAVFYDLLPYDGVIRVWDIDSHEVIHTTPAGGARATPISWTPDANILTFRGVGGSGYPFGGIVDPNNLITENNRLYDDRLRFSPDGAMLATSSYSNGRVRLLNPNTFELIDELDGDINLIHDVGWSQDSQKLVVASVDEIQMWDVSRHEILVDDLSYLGDYAAFNGWSPDGNYLAVSSNSGGTIHTHHNSSVRIWDFDTLQPVMSLRNHDLYVGDATWIPNGERIVSVNFGNERPLRIWDSFTGETLLSIDDIAYPSRTVASDNNGKFVVSANQEGDIKIWDTVTGENLLVIDSPDQIVEQLAWDSDANLLFGTTRNSSTQLYTLRFWDSVTGEQLDEPSVGGRMLKWQWGESLITVFNDDHDIEVWSFFRTENRIDRHHVTTISLPSEYEIIAVEWNPKRRILAILSEADFGRESFLHMADVNTGEIQEIAHVDGYNTRLNDIVWHPDGDLFATSQYAGIVRIWQEFNS